MVTTVNRQRVESTARWQSALQRAIANGIEPLQIAGTGEWVATSASKIGTVYRTDGVNCECDAGLAGNPVCQHRAVVRFIRGHLVMPDAAETPASIDCPSCGGRGWTYCGDDYYWPYQIACRRCAGDGRVAVWLTTVAAAATD